MAVDIFSTVPEQDYLSLYKDKKLQYNRIVKFFDFAKEDISQATGIPKSNVRYDERIPIELRDRIREWAVLLNLVAGFFKGDKEKTIQWFTIPNPLLGNISPRDMIKLGRYAKLIKFVLNALEENTP